MKHRWKGFEPYDGEPPKDYRLVFLWFFLMFIVAVIAVIKGLHV